MRDPGSGRAPGGTGSATSTGYPGGP